MAGMKQISKYLRLKLRDASGRDTGHWVSRIDLAKLGGITFPLLAVEYAERHPEKYVVRTEFTPEENKAMKIPKLEIALRYQNILKQKGIDTRLAGKQ
jgi:hypothetical protein